MWNDSGDPPTRGQEVPKTTPTTAGTGGESSWVKVCTADEKTDNTQVCLVRYEGLDPKTGAILISVAVRTIEGEDKKHLLVNMPTAYSLVMPAGVQIKIDEGEPIQLQYAVFFPTSCQVQMELSSNIQGQDPQFVAALSANWRSSEAEFGSTTSRINPPAIGQILFGQLKPDSAIGTGDQGACHRILQRSASLVRRHALRSQFFE